MRQYQKVLLVRGLAGLCSKHFLFDSSFPHFSGIDMKKFLLKFLPPTRTATVLLIAGISFLGALSGNFNNIVKLIDRILPYFQNSEELAVLNLIENAASRDPDFFSLDSSASVFRARPNGRLGRMHTPYVLRLYVDLSFDDESPMQSAFFHALEAVQVSTSSSLDVLKSSNCRPSVVVSEQELQSDFSTEQGWEPGANAQRYQCLDLLFPDKPQTGEIVSLRIANEEIKFPLPKIMWEGQSSPRRAAAELAWKIEDLSWPTLLGARAFHPASDKPNRRTTLFELTFRNGGVSPISIQEIRLNAILSSSINCQIGPNYTGPDWISVEVDMSVSQQPSGVWHTAQATSEIGGKKIKTQARFQPADCFDGKLEVKIPTSIKVEGGDIEIVFIDFSQITREIGVDDNLQQDFSLGGWRNIVLEFDKTSGIIPTTFQVQTGNAFRQ